MQERTGHVRIIRLPGVFKPHSDTLMLGDYMMREPLPRTARVLDLCSGSGLLAILSARRPGTNVVAVDVSRRAVITTKLNARLNGVQVDAIRGDLFEPLNGDRFDLIVSNPPYLPSTGGEPSSHSSARAWDAGSTGRAFIERICAGACRHLRPNGILLMIHSSVCGEDETLAALAGHGLQATVAARRRGPLGPLLRSRAAWLRSRGLVGEDQLEELLVIRAQRLK